MSAWRWVVERNMGTYDFAYTREDYAPTIGIVVPVVPCDEAAIQRVMSELGNWPDGSNLRDMAEAVFRAAGETP